MAHEGGLLFDPALNAAYHHYRWATDRRNAVTVCVRDVQRLGYAFPSLFEQGVLRMFLHHHWPCIYVTLVATVVAVREQEVAMEYIVPMLAVGDVVRINGRVFERRDKSRVVDVERVERVEATQEPLHLLRALAYGAERYTQPPPLPTEHVDVATVDRIEAPKIGAASSNPWSATGHAKRAPETPHPLPKQHDTSEEATLPVVASTRSMVLFLARYLQDKTQATNDAAMLSPPLLHPTFTIPQLLSSATVQFHAQRLVTYKLPERTLSADERDAKVAQLITHCVRRLVRTGVLLERRARTNMFQVVCPALIAGYIAVLVRHTPQQRREEVRRFSSASMRRRVCAAEPRLACVPLSKFDAALALLADAALVVRYGTHWGVP
ncbi:hypothetical protein MBRA1_000822 [Malassezia brasiliensis]|uniref:Uncharacterized protein n=1 Tax=Malassezia brasiliensis TaxID=1821822 RepID=A0AAF0DR16_9BASI|nr:hypothetical protein MBRA1_000822 [Malassezia brasiliensis]